MIVILGVVALLLVLVIAVVTARGPGPAPQHGPTWGALDAAAIEDAVQAAMPKSTPDPELLELARHHAFSMASRGFPGAETPEGEGHDARRQRLAPLFVGPSAQRQVLLPREPGTREAELANQALSQLGEAVRAAPAAIGAAVEDGKCAVVAVQGTRVATLRQAPPSDVQGGLLEIEGEMEPGLRADALEAEWNPEGSWVPAGRSQLRGEEPPEDPELPVPFSIELSVPEGSGPLELRLRHDGTLVYSVAIRRG